VKKKTVGPAGAQEKSGTAPFYNPAFEDAHRHIIDHYHVPERDIGIFLPCTMRKPYSASPSHQIYRRAIFSVLPHEDVHLIVFGTCGVVPAELERMYPFTHYRYMLGRCRDPVIRRDFQRIETARLTAYLKKTRTTYRCRVAYCLGQFREAMMQASGRAGIPVLLAPSDATIAEHRQDHLRFPEGSLCMEGYLAEFTAVLSGLGKK